MEIRVRKTHNFVELRTDGNQDTIFKTDKKEALDTIHNLLDVIDSLIGYTDTDIVEILKKRGDLN